MIPFCAENHWVLYVAELPSRHVRLYDSINKTATRPNETNSVIAYLQAMVSDVKWQFLRNDVSSPWNPVSIHSNGFDCGLFVILHA